MSGLGIRTVVVPLDGTPSAERALPVAGFLAAALGAEVHLLAVAGSAGTGAALERAVARAKALLAGRAGEARVAYDFATAERIVAATAPPHAVACMATGWRAGTSIARRVVVGSDGPVVLVGPQAADPPRTDGTLLTCFPGHAGAEVLTRTTSVWADALGLPLTELTAGADPVGAALTYEREHPVVMIGWAIPVGRRRHAGRAARDARALIRRCHAPVLAVPLR